MPGTFKKVIIDGINFDVKADNDAALIGGAYDNASIPHSGGNEQQKVRRATGLTGLTLTVSALQDEQLNNFQKRTRNYPLAYVDVKGNTYRTVGFINYQGMTSSENTGTLDMFSKDADGFTLFAA
jgi:hypothetical protein